jgi:hypothetical protein
VTALVASSGVSCFHIPVAGISAVRKLESPPTANDVLSGTLCGNRVIDGAVLCDWPRFLKVCDTFSINLVFCFSSLTPPWPFVILLTQRPTACRSTLLFNTIVNGHSYKLPTSDAKHQHAFNIWALEEWVS